MHAFDTGRSYRREEVLSFLGSKQPVSGIVYGGREQRYMAVFSGGRDGKRAGYPDGWDPEGVFRYCGQGSKGDQKFQGANARLAGHDGPILLFETWKPRNSWKGMQRFLGTFRVMGHEFIIGDGIRKGNRLIIFSLLPEPALPPLIATVAPIVAGNVPLTELRSRAVAAGHDYTATRLTITECRYAREQGHHFAKSKSSPQPPADPLDGPLE